MDLFVDSIRLDSEFQTHSINLVTRSNNLVLIRLFWTIYNGV